LAVLGRPAGAKTLVFLPVLHEQAGDVRIGGGQQEGGNRGIDAARNADHDQSIVHGNQSDGVPAGSWRTKSRGSRRPPSQSSMLCRISGLRKRSLAATMACRSSQSARRMPLSSGRVGSWCSGLAANVKRTNWLPETLLVHCCTPIRHSSSTSQPVSSRV